MEKNEFLRQYQEGERYFAHVDLRGVCLDYTELSYIHLQQADLRDASLRGANLCSADLAEALLEGADLEDTNLSGADLIDAHVSKAQLRRARYLADARLPWHRRQQHWLKWAGGIAAVLAFIVVLVWAVIWSPPELGLGAGVLSGFVAAVLAGVLVGGLVNLGSMLPVARPMLRPAPSALPYGLAGRLVGGIGSASLVLVAVLIGLAILGQDTSAPAPLAPATPFPWAFLWFFPLVAFVVAMFRGRARQTGPEGPDLSYGAWRRAFEGAISGLASRLPGVGLGVLVLALGLALGHWRLAMPPWVALTAGLILLSISLPWYITPRCTDFALSWSLGGHPSQRRVGAKGLDYPQKPQRIFFLGQPDVARLQAKGNTHALIRAVSHPSVLVSLSAEKALAELAKHAAIPHLKAILRDPDRPIWVREGAGVALKQLGLTSLQSLLDFPKPPSPDPIRVSDATYDALERWRYHNAIVAIDLMQAEHDVDHLAAFLTYPERNVKHLAIKALGAVGGEPAANVLIPLLHEAGPAIVDVVDALIRIGTPAVEPLLAACRAEPADRLISRWLYQAEHEADPALRRREPIPVLSLHDDSRIEPPAVFALSQIDPPPVASLVSALEAGDPLRRYAAQALARISARQALGEARPQAENALIAVLERFNSSGRGLYPGPIEYCFFLEAVCAALGRMASQRAVPQLILALEERAGPDVGTVAAWALGVIGDPSAADALEAFRRLAHYNYRSDESVSVASRALRKIRKEPETAEVAEETPPAEEPQPSDTRTAEELIRVLNNDEAQSADRVSAASELGRRRDPSTVAALSRAVQSHDEDLPEAAVRALGQIATPDAMGELLNAPPWPWRYGNRLHDLHNQVKEILLQIGNPVATWLLRGLER